MKLYAHVYSDRASKGQGGNSFVTITLSVGSAKESRKIAEVSLTLLLDKTSYQVKYTPIKQERGQDIYLASKLLQEGELKGKKQ